MRWWFRRIDIEVYRKSVIEKLSSLLRLDVQNAECFWEIKGEKKSTTVGLCNSDVLQHEILQAFQLVCFAPLNGNTRFWQLYFVDTLVMYLFSKKLKRKRSYWHSSCETVSQYCAEQLVVCGPFDWSAGPLQTPPVAQSPVRPRLSAS